MNLSPNATALGTGEVGEGRWWHPHQTPQFTQVSPPQGDRGCISKHPNSAWNRAACPHLFLERHSRGTSVPICIQMEQPCVYSGPSTLGREENKRKACNINFKTFSNSQ